MVGGSGGVGRRGVLEGRDEDLWEDEVELEVEEEEEFLDEEEEDEGAEDRERGGKSVLESRFGVLCEVFCVEDCDDDDEVENDLDWIGL